MSVDFLAIGHITHDLTSDGFRLGGTVTFAAITARRLGRRPAIVTCASAEGLIETGQGWMVGAPETPLSGIPISSCPSSVSTTFSNIYHDGQRTQIISAVAEPVPPHVLPDEWAAAPIVLLGPIARETPASWLPLFPHGLLGMTPQGMMRRWDDRGRVYFGGWSDADGFLARADAIIVSREDVAGDERVLAGWAAQTRLLVVTDGWHGATFYEGGQSWRVPPRAALEVDPTGAGDVFATAFLIRLAETGSAYAAARFANVVASMSVEGVGIAAIPDRTRVDEWFALKEKIS